MMLKRMIDSVGKREREDLGSGGGGDLGADEGARRRGRGEDVGGEELSRRPGALLPLEASKSATLALLTSRTHGVF